MQKDQHYVAAIEQDYAEGLSIITLIRRLLRCASHAL